MKALPLMPPRSSTHDGSKGNKAFLLGCLFTVAIFFVMQLAIQMHSMKFSPLVLAQDKPKEDASKIDLLGQIQILKGNLTNATLEIMRLRQLLKSCSKNQGSDSDSDSEDNSKPKMSDEDEAKYKQYLLDFNIKEKAKRDHWPWLDDTLYFGRLGGDNRIQYSEADAAIDSGHAEAFGQDRTLPFDDLDKSFKDSSYYGGRA
jgi:hypothetical protein